MHSMAKCAHRSDCALGFTSYKDLQMRYEKVWFQWPKAELIYDCKLRNERKTFIPNAQ
jgi:hypothetical protein